MKLSKITTEVEKAFGLCYASDVSIYMEDTFLDQLAASHPSNYLKILSETHLTLIQPDLVYYGEKQQFFLYLRAYPFAKQLGFLCVRVEHGKRKKKWYVTSIAGFSQEQYASLLEGGSFVRIGKKKSSRGRPRKKLEEGRDFPFPLSGQ